MYIKSCTENEIGKFFLASPWRVPMGSHRLPHPASPSPVELVCPEFSTQSGREEEVPYSDAEGQTKVCLHKMGRYC